MLRELGCKTGGAASTAKSATGSERAYQAQLVAPVVFPKAKLKIR
jgi:hypothetical protein